MIFSIIKKLKGESRKFVSFFYFKKAATAQKNGFDIFYSLSIFILQFVTF